MGLIALIISVVIDAIWPLRGRGTGRTDDDDFASDTFEFATEPGLSPAGPAAAADAPDGDLIDDPPYDPLADAIVDAGVAVDTDGGNPTPPDAASRPAVKPAPHPLQRHALRLLRWIAPDEADAAGPRRRLGAPGWLAMVGIPVVLVALAQALLGEIAGVFVLLLHVAVLYYTVGLGAFHRRFSELRLLVGAGELASARVALARWVASDCTGRSPTSTRWAQPLPEATAAHAVLAAYREVFAPLFWYAVLPGAVGPVLYLFARFAACFSFPFAVRALYWLDWIPLRLAALGFALVGQFEDTIFALKTVNGIRPEAVESVDPTLHQRLVLWPTAGGALRLRLGDAEVEARLREVAPELDLPGPEPQAGPLQSMAGLLMRSAVVWLVVWLLLKLVG
jgi:adenosylcobinamide-phosphate synthase